MLDFFSFYYEHIESINLTLRSAMLVTLSCEQDRHSSCLPRVKNLVGKTNLQIYLSV